MPEYRLIEQLLLRQGAFDEGRRQHQEHAEAVEDIEEEIEMEMRPSGRATVRGRVLLIAALILASLALLLIVFALLVR
jgi:hypothetical protein